MTTVTRCVAVALTITLSGLVTTAWAGGGQWTAAGDSQYAFSGTVSQGVQNQNVQYGTQYTGGSTAFDFTHSTAGYTQKPQVKPWRGQFPVQYGPQYPTYQVQPKVRPVQSQVPAQRQVQYQGVVYQR
jgi:hypothetical protein